MAKYDLTLAQVRAPLHYDPETGHFTRLVRRASAPAGARADKPVGDRGYRLVTINRFHYLAHRLAWFYAHGEWPAECIDHIDCDPSNNRLANLRSATKSQNTARAIRKSKSAVRGAKVVGNRWRSFICAGGKFRHLGYFDTAKEANAAYYAAAKSVYGEFAESGAPL